MKLRLTSRIILIFVLFASALLAGVGMLSYRSGREALFTALTSEILAMAMEKQAELDHWFEERVTELKRVGTMEGVRGEILLLNRLDPAAPETAPARGRLVEALRTNMDGTLTGYLEILLLNTKGEIIASTQEGETGKARGSEVFFERGKETVYINSPALSEPGGVPYIMVSLPVRSESGKLLAVLAGRLDITTMGTIVQRRTGLRETDDAFLVNPAGIAVTQPRFLFEPAVLTRRIDTQAVRLCIRGNSGVTFGTDYRGVPVISVYQWISSRHLGLILEIDQSEALAPVRSFGNDVLWVSAVALLAACILAYWLARGITQPLRALHERVARFGRGEPDTQIEEFSSDELGRLGQEFTKMARAISANEAQLRASGTELQGTNAELQMEVAERKRGEKELEESLSLLHATLESTVDGILVADPAGRIVKYNGKFAKMWGLNDENLAHWNEQQTVALLADQLEEDAGFLATARDLADQPDASTFDLLRFKDGRVFERHSHPQKIAGQSVGRVWCFRDITERITAELNLESAHRQLLESSRRAGMAEVATSVLHNVGNVLNSVNISCAVISEKLSRSRISAVKKMALLLEEQAGDLARFFTTDPKGQKLPAFLGKLSDQLLSEQALILQEVHSLGQNIEHIKNIVATQQGHAKKISGISETLALEDLVEEALQMTAESLGRHRIVVVREFEKVPPIPVEKHKVLQILVNLIQNAKDAMWENEGERKLHIRIGLRGESVAVDFQDHGIGIPPENLTRVFGHGFTTKKSGHGFGLHSAVLAAQEMHGTLGVHSEGSGKGATFTLTLPLEPAQKAAPQV